MTVDSDVVSTGASWFYRDAQWRDRNIHNRTHHNEISRPQFSEEQSLLTLPQNQWLQTEAANTTGAFFRNTPAEISVITNPTGNGSMNV